MNKKDNFLITPIGIIRSEIKNKEDAPLFYSEGAPDVLLDIYPEYADGLHLMKPGQELIVITWFHLADRSELKTHPRNDLSNPLTGVFLTRSPDRPNPLGLHRVKLLAINDTQLHIGPMEAIDGTPVVDIKPVVGTDDH